MAVEILVQGFVAPAVEGEIVFVGVETGEGAEDARSGWARLLVDAGLDVEVLHGLHEAGADLEDGERAKGVGGERCGWMHDGGRWK